MSDASILDAQPLSSTRRRLLQMLGGLAASPSIALAGSDIRPLRVTLWLPDSSRYPLAAMEFAQGFAAHAGPNIDLSLHHEPEGLIGPGPATRLIDSARAHRSEMIVGLGLPIRLQTTDKQCPLSMHCDLGARVKPSTGTLHQSLDYWQANLMQGLWAAQTLGRKALVMTDLHEAGYDFVPAFLAGFEAAGGKPSLATCGQPTASGPADPDLPALLRQHRPDFVQAFFSGHRAERFHQLWQATGASLPLSVGAAYVSPISGARHPRTAWRVAGWAEHQLATCRPDTLCAASGALSPSALLGAEAGTRLTRAWHTAEAHPGRLEEALRTAPASSIRRSAVAGTYWLHAHADQPRMLAPDALIDEWAAQRPRISTGWATPYLLT